MRIEYILLLMSLGGMVGMAAAEDPVYFADAELKTAVENALSISDPTPTDMQGLVSLSAISKNISNLIGLEHAVNLNTLQLRLNQITNVSPLAGLTQLKKLVLNNNQISNLSPLSGLTLLQHLDIHENQITNISALSGLTALEYLNLHDNQISNLAPLAGLTQLKTLLLQLNPVHNISPLAGLDNLQELTIEQTLIENISPLAGLPKLRSLSLNHNKISSLPSFTSSNLKSLYLRNNLITNISPLVGITSLYSLDLRNNPLNSDTCRYKIPQIMLDNPGIYIQVNTCDPNPTLDYAVHFSSDRGGSVISPGEGEFVYRYGVKVLMEAKAGPEYTFVGWTGTHLDTNNPTWLTVDQTHQIHAKFESVLDFIYVDVNGPGDVGPFDANVSDPNENGTADHPFDSIQEAIDVTGEDVWIKVRSGTYHEEIDFLGKHIRVTGSDPGDPNTLSYPILAGTGSGPVVHFTQGVDANGLLQGFVITGGQGAIECSDSSVTVSHCLIVGNDSVQPSSGTIDGTSSSLRLLNCTISDNRSGLTFFDSTVELKNSIVWGNPFPSISLAGSSEVLIHYCDIEGQSFPESVGTLGVDPLFVLRGYWSYAKDPNGVWMSGDYHFQSEAGRWDMLNGNWAMDDMTSPCIDTGDPTDGIGSEPFPNGGFINMGAYGGTARASKSNP